MSKEITKKHFIQKPIYPGGNKALHDFIKQNLKYPEVALENQVEGYVSIRYDIDHKGNVTGAKVISSLSPECDHEAIRVLKLLKFDVAKQYKARVIFHKKIRIHFHPKTGLVESQEVTEQESETSELSEQATIQYQYAYTTQKSTKPNPSKSKSNSYHYTINVNS